MRIAELTSLLASALADRTDRGRSTVINLDPDALVLYRHYGPESIPDGLTVGALLAGESGWEPVGRVSRLLERMAPGYGGCGAEEVLPFLTVDAADWTARLARQMGAKLRTPINSDAIDSRFASAYKACVAEARRLQQLSCTLTDAMMKWLTHSPSSSAPEGATMLRLTTGKDEVSPARRGCHTAVAWLAKDGQELRRETLEELQARMSSAPEIADLLDSAKRLQTRQEQHQALGDEILQGMSKGLAQAVQAARSESRCVGYRVCSAKVRRLPAEVYLFVDPGVRGHAGVYLVARRAHHEFVLENAQRKLFYFPPVQLVAIIEFRASSPSWHVAIPRIRMPANHPPWVHPYSGKLDCDRFARAKLLGGGREAMVPPSEKAKQLFPAMKNRPADDPGMSDLCLDGQRARLKQLARQVQLQGNQPDVFGLVQGIWALVRQGLTRAHQRNTETPRVSLESGRMCYPVTNRSALAGTSLANRIFRYDAL